MKSGAIILTFLALLTTGCPSTTSEGSIECQEEVCDDGVECTAEQCNPNSGACESIPDHRQCLAGEVCKLMEGCEASGCGQDAHCNDGVFCNGIERCADSICVAGDDPCDDGIVCTTDLCDNAGSSCQNNPDSQLCEAGELCSLVAAGCVPEQCTADSECDDRIFCNGSEICQNGSCQRGDAPCDDGIDCTRDDCDEAADQCQHVPDSSSCQDDSWCNGSELCQPGQGCIPGSAPDCDDSVSCTIDSCDETADGCLSQRDDSACDDGLWCNGDEICHPLQDCQPGSAVGCNDGIACTTDSCDEASDSCQNAPNDSACSDGLWCNGNEICDPALGCQAGTATDCDDSIACTSDICDEQNDQCQNLGNDAMCSDSQWCNGDEYCDAAIGCLSGTAPNCDDAVPCTADLCDEGNDACVFTPGNANCDDGLWCNGAETCDATLGCLPGQAPNCTDSIACTDDSCDETSDQCLNATNDASCSDGLWCNGDESCDPTVGCQAGAAPNCDDGTACTDDSCDETADTCLSMVNDANCDNGAWCDGSEICDPSLGCLAGTPPNCDDGVGCTDDSCDEVGDVCINTANDANCDDGAWCNGVESCDATLDCQAGTAPDCDDSISCTDDSCDEVGDLCLNAANDANCDDSLYCNGAESCDPALDCQAGTAPDCDDGIICTDDSCDEVGDSCQNLANNSNCDNGLWCDGAETCDPVTDCQAGTAPNCDDSIACTDDSCDEGADVCVNTANDTNCDNGDWCDGAEICDPALDCQAGGAPNCDDAVGCTDDSCDEVGDVCVNITNNANCDDGAWCNGAETCDAALDCQTGSPPNCDDAVGCTDDSCDEAGDICVNTANSANCDDGAWCNGTESCDAALDCQAGSPPNCDDGVGCTDDSCNEAGDACVNTANNANCNDGNQCTINACDPALDCQVADNDGIACSVGPCSSTCLGGLCTGCSCTVPADCDDGVACTVDNCVAGVCSNTPSNALCDNGLWCDGTDSCDPVTGCQPGTAPNCDDSIGCTTDLCDEAGDACINAVNDASCDNGAWCDGAETCDALLDCQLGVPPNCDDFIGCTDDSCNEAGDNCIATTNDANCANGFWCDGAETCDPVSDCQPGTAPNCDDAVGCTDDSCDEVGDACVNAANDTSCDNGAWCDGAESCDALVDCQAGVAPDCDDSVGCTDDSCDEVGDVCVNAMNDGNCDNGDWCDGAETCDTVTGCQPGTVPDCDDSVACTDDSCDEAGDVCVNAAVDLNCDDGFFCSGAESCDPVLGCQSGPLPCDDGDDCTDDSCVEISDTCNNVANTAPCDDLDPCTDPDFCAGGLCSGPSLDVDGDLYTPLVCGGLDCNDGDYDINPGFFEGSLGDGVCSDNLDNDCDGRTDDEEKSCLCGADSALSHVRSERYGDLLDERARAVFVDRQGNLYLAGRFRTYMDLGGFVHTSNGQEDIFIGSFDSQGVHRWSRSFGGFTADEGLGLAGDSFGKVYLTGNFSGTIDFGDGPRGAVGGSDAFIACFDNAGGFLWAQDFGSAGTDSCTDIRVDPGNNIVIAGNSGGVIDFGGGPQGGSGAFDSFVASFDSGGSWRWSQVYGDGSNQLMHGLDIDSQGNIYFTGQFDGTIDIGGGAHTAGFTEVYLASLDSDGNYRWSQDFASGWSTGLTVDPWGRVTIIGSCSMTIDLGGGPIDCTPGSSIFVASFDRQGSYRWATTYGNGAIQNAQAIAADSSGNTYSTGYTMGAIDLGGGLLGAAGNQDVFLLSLDPGGNHRDSYLFGDTDDEEGYAITTAAPGVVYLAGAFKQNIDFGGGPLASVGAYDAFVAKFTNEWSRVLAGPGYVTVQELAVSDCGDSFPVGDLNGSADLGGGSRTSNGGDDGFIAGFDGAGVSLWDWYGGDGDNQVVFDAGVDAVGNVYLTGYFGGQVDFGGGPLTSAGGSDVFLASYTAAGGYRFSQRFGDTGATQWGNGIGVNASGDNCITGWNSGSIDFGGGSIAIVGGLDSYLACFDSSGSHLWSLPIASVDSERGNGVAVSSGGEVTVTGYFNGPIDFGGGLRTSVGTYDIYLASYAADGAWRWDQTFGGPVDDFGWSVAADAAGNVFATGRVIGPVDFGGGSVTTNGMDAYAVAYDSAGSYLWGQPLGGPSSDIGYSVAADVFGNSYFTGDFQGTGDFGGQVLTSNGNKDAYLAGFDLAGNLITLRGFGGTSADIGEGVAVDIGGDVYLTGTFMSPTIELPDGTVINQGNRDSFMLHLIP